MPEILIPPLDRAVRWSRDGGWYTGEVELSDEHGEIARLTGRVSRTRALALMDNLRAQLARQAPAGVNVGAWSDAHGPSQRDLHEYVLGEELRRSLTQQVNRRGWLARPPWFDPWDVDTVTRAYRLIVAAQAGDEFATRQLGSIREAALNGSPPAREALAKFQADGRVIARGMSLAAMLAAMGASEDDLGVVEAGVMRGGGGGRPSRTPARVVRPSRAAVMRRPTVSAAPVYQAPLARITPLRVPVAAAPFVMPPITPGVSNTAPLAQPYPYGYGAPPYSGGGGGGGDSGGGGGSGSGGGDDDDLDDDTGPDEEFPDDLDAETGSDGSSGSIGELGFDPNEEMPPPPPPKGSRGGSGRGNRRSRDEDDDDEFPEPPADDGSGHANPAAAPDNGGQDPGGPPVDAGPGDDDDDERYPGEGDPMGSAG